MRWRDPGAGFGGTSYAVRGGGLMVCEKASGSKARSSFFEKKEPKKLFSVWLRFEGRLGSLRPEGVFAARLGGQGKVLDCFASARNDRYFGALGGARNDGCFEATGARGQKFFWFFFFKKRTASFFTSDPSPA
jgi:hypothetical protein